MNTEQTSKNIFMNTISGRISIATDESNHGNIYVGKSSVLGIAVHYL